MGGELSTAYHREPDTARKKGVVGLKNMQTRRRPRGGKEDMVQEKRRS